MDSGMKPTLSERLSTLSRIALVAAIVVVTVLIVVGPRNHGVSNPLEISRAQASSLGAAPGYLMLTLPVGQASALYITDTNKQVIVGYTIAGDKLRLVSARKFDFDSDIFDMSIQAPNGRVPEGGNGITRDEAEVYAKHIAKAFEDFKANFKKKPAK